MDDYTPSRILLVCLATVLCALGGTLRSASAADVKNSRRNTPAPVQQSATDPDMRAAAWSVETRDGSVYLQGEPE